MKIGSSVICGRLVTRPRRYAVVGVVVGGFGKGAVRSFHRVLYSFCGWEVSMRISTTDDIVIAFTYFVI